MQTRSTSEPMRTGSIYRQVLPLASKPTVEIVQLTGLTYRQVYDALRYLGKQPGKRPAGMCRNGHIAPKVTFRNGGGIPQQLCSDCRRGRDQRYRDHQRRNRKWLFGVLQAKLEARQASHG